MMEQWKPYEGQPFDYSGDLLQASWKDIHAGNLEPFPEDEELQETWRAYHEGRFQEAMERGEKFGGAHLVPANFATIIYAQYVETDDKRKIELFQSGIELGKRATEACPESANAFYMLAVSYGRHSQFISMIEALQQGVGPKIRDNASRCVELEPKHAEGHVTLAVWNAEIVDKVGSMLGGLMYGAKKDQAEENYRKARELAPESPVPYVESAYGMMMMYGEMEREKIAGYLETALQKKPMDAMQTLDLEKARQVLEQLPTMKL